MPRLARIEFGSNEANKILKADKEYKLSPKYLENILEPTDAEMDLMREWDELVGAQDEYNYAESALMQTQASLQKAKKTVLEERKHETRTSQ